jgi:hypothetical protein
MTTSGNGARLAFVCVQRTKEIAMKRTLAALGLAALAGTTILTGVNAAEPFKAPVQRVAEARPGHGGPHRGPEGMRPDGHRGGPQIRLAAQLSAAETLIGVRSNQIDAWRDYTSALLDLVRPPEPPKPGDGEPDAAKAFAREERLAREITERAAKAATLTKTIEVLKTTLTSDQLEKLASVDLRLGPPMGPHRGPGMMGPDRGGPGMKGPGGPGDMRHGGMDGEPPFGPDAGPRGPEDPDTAPDAGAQPGTAPTPG